MGRPPSSDHDNLHRRQGRRDQQLDPLHTGQKGPLPMGAGWDRVRARWKWINKDQNQDEGVETVWDEKQQKALRSTLEWNRPLPLDTPAHDIHPGDQVYVKNWSVEPLKETWDGPHQVIMTTYTAVKVEGINNWIHYTRVKKVPSRWELDGTELGHDGNGSTRIKLKMKE
ncbi:uncharacterized protein ACIQIH_000505 isoform 1-T1 [Cyanocitta cristata]